MKSAAPRGDRLYGLEVGRGVAATLVLLSHISLIIGEPRFYGAVPWGGVFARFGAGVDFFFVLSGFIIAWIHWADIGRPAELKRYALRRFRRIYPPYWGVLLPLSFLYFFVAPNAGDPSQHDPANFVASFFLIPYPEHPILGVAWTLVYEIIFYIIFAGLIAWGRGMFWLLGAWGVAVLAVNLSVDRLAYPFTILLDVRNLQFLMGIAAAWWIRRWPVPVPRLTTAIGVGLFATFLITPIGPIDDPLIGRLGFGLASVLAIVGVVAWESGARVAIPAPLRLLGAASYSIYLVHGVAISIGIQIIVRVLPRDVPAIVPIAALLVAGLAAGIAYHLLAEKPLLRLVARWPRRRPLPEPVGTHRVG